MNSRHDFTLAHRGHEPGRAGPLGRPFCLRRAQRSRPTRNRFMDRPAGLAEIANASSRRRLHLRVRTLVPACRPARAARRAGSWENDLVVGGGRISDCLVAFVANRFKLRPSTRMELNSGRCCVLMTAPGVCRLA